MESTDSGSSDTPKESATAVCVYYNGACPVCNAGISMQKQKSTMGDIEWVDVDQQQKRVDDVHQSIEYVRERLHVIDEHGRVCVGVDAFAVLWRHSEKERWKARLITLPVINALAQWGYNLFARGLYRWNRNKGHW